MLAAERRWWREINSAQAAFAAQVTWIEATRARWHRRITAAMRGVEPRAWWRCNRRIEAGERWVAAKGESRWVQRVVYVTRDRVLELVAQRDARLTQMEAVCATAEERLREAVRQPVATFGVVETARRLGLPAWTVADLISTRRMSPADRRLLSGASEPLEVPD